MPTFTYEALDRGGKEVKQEIDANTQEEAISKIRNLGYFPTKVREKGIARAKAGAAGGPQRRGIGDGRIPAKQLTQFTRQLSTLQDAGLPMLRSLRILEQQQKPGTMRSVVRGIAEDVEGGSTLSEAMARRPKAFTRLYSNMIRAGEAGGVLELILQRLAEFMEKSEKLKARVKGAMIYPIVVLCFAGIILTGIMLFIVPNFQKIFADINTPLPPMTVVLITVSDWFARGFGWLYLLALPVVIYAAVKLMRQSPGGAYVLDKFKLSVPLFGTIINKNSISQFCRTLGTLINAGVPILEAINITRETTGNEVVSQALGKVHDSIREGESVAAPLRASRICDPIVVNMIDVGEETGDLDKMLLKVADNYDEEVDTLVGSLVSVLEPLMVIVLGVIVGLIVVSLFLPLVSIIESVGSKGAGGK
jgi:type IV pilus assembly protein PilC